jgi:uncharacterized phage-associated protein
MFGQLLRAFGFALPPRNAPSGVFDRSSHAACNGAGGSADCRAVRPFAAFDEIKAAHVAAWFLARAGGRMNVLKLMKLMYLAERESYREHGEPIIGDRLVSMPHGPVLSMTYSYTSGQADPSPTGWDAWIADREQHDVVLARRLDDPERDLDRLSDADIAVLERIWDDFGALSQYALRDWTHDHCGEWTDPDGSSLPIELPRLFAALGYSPAQAEELATRASAQSACQGKVRAQA